MNRTELVKIIEQEKLVFETRLKDHTKAQSVISSLMAGGAKVMGITSNTPNYTDEISKSRKLHKDVLIGVGTVTNRRIALEAIKIGAQFLVIPNSNLELIEVANQHDIPILMGALTPTEVCAAWEAGADFVKLFPADIMGIPYFKSIKAPLNNVKLLAVSGMRLDTIVSWMAAGADGIGIASVLSEPILNEKNLDKIKKNAEAFVKEIKRHNE